PLPPPALNCPAAAPQAAQAAVGLHGARPKKEIIGLKIWSVPSLPSPEVESETMHDPTGDFILSRENIAHRTIESPRPERPVIQCADKLYVDAQLVSSPKDRPLKNVVGPKLTAHVAYLARLPFENKG